MFRRHIISTILMLPYFGWLWLCNDSLSGMQNAIDGTKDDPGPRCGTGLAAFAIFAIGVALVYTLVLFIRLSFAAPENRKDYFKFILLVNVPLVVMLAFHF